MSETTAPGYRARIIKHMNDLRLQGVLESQVLHVLRCTSLSDRWDSEAGFDLFRSLFQTDQPPLDADLMEEFFQAVGASYANGDGRIGDHILTGEPMRRVYGPGYYQQRLESVLWDMYCDCASAIQKHLPEPAPCDFCQERARITKRAFAHYALTPQLNRPTP